MTNGYYPVRQLKEPVIGHLEGHEGTVQFFEDGFSLWMHSGPVAVVPILTWEKMRSNTTLASLSKDDIAAVLCKDTLSLMEPVDHNAG